MKGKKKIHYLVTLSTSEGVLDPKKIEIIATMLSKKELSKYLRLLRKIRLWEKVTVATAIDLTGSLAAKFGEIFKGKDILYFKDESLLAGLTVQFGDFVLDASVKALIERMREQYENEVN